MTDTDVQPHVEAVRRFNRFYTRQIGALEEGLLKSPFSLTEARVIWELAQHERTTASDLGEALGLDAGYLSRILQGFRARGLIDRRPSESDGRQSLLWLTEEGRAAFARLDADTRDQIGAMLFPLPPDEQRRLVGAMRTIERLLGRGGAGTVTLRPHRPGDMGWVVQRHGELYWREFGWDERFEALVAGVAAQFIREFDPAWERSWIAEVDGERAGSVFATRESDEVAKLRLLLVEPWARGHGIGARLVDECIAFSREKGYRTLRLWTNHVLVSARRIYQAAGFRLVGEETHDSFGTPLVAETWELEL